MAMSLTDYINEYCLDQEDIHIQSMKAARALLLQDMDALANTDPGMKDLLDKAEAYYLLKRE